MDVSEAVAQIDQIRSHLERTETFRGYRWQTVALSGALAIAGVVVQTVAITDPVRSLPVWLMLWVGIAVCSAGATATELLTRLIRSGSPRAIRSVRSAVVRFVPCLVSGGLLTWVLVVHAGDSVWMLPGLWSILFSQGVFASAAMLPRGVVWVGCHYLVAGLLCLVAAQGGQSLAPWTMLVTFGVGQVMAAVVLYRGAEDGDE